MRILETDGVSLGGVCACIPEDAEDNLTRCRELFGDEAKAAAIVQATGIATRRLAKSGTSPFDLCLTAARRLLADTKTGSDEIGGVVFVCFTSDRQMPGNACRIQAALGLPNDVIALDLQLACAGYGYGLHLAATYAKATGRKILLLDGDVQSARLNPQDAATVPVLADAGTATLVVLEAGAPAWRFAFLSKGEGGEALVLPWGGTIGMDGFGVFRFVAGEVSAFLRDFMKEARRSAADYARFVPHQANVYMIRQLAKSLGFAPEQLCVSADRFGNPASASVPLTLAATCGGVGGNVLLSGFGGGLSAFAADIRIPPHLQISLISDKSSF